MGRVRRFRALFGIDEIASGSTLWKSLLAEFLGTALLVLVTCGSCTAWAATGSPTIVQISLTFGFTVATIVQCIGHVSGGHINPGVTAGMLATGKVSIIRGLLYILIQSLGGIAGAAVLKAVTPYEHQGMLGATVPHENMTPLQAVAIEFIITFILVFTVFAACDSNRLDVKGSVPLAIGLSIAICHLWTINYTGAGMNPARSLGPAVMLPIWTAHWVYWVGPILGGVVAGLLYEFVFAVPPPTKEALERARLQSFQALNDKEVVADRTTSI